LLFLDRFNAFSLLSVVRVLKNFIDLVLLLSLILLKEVLGLLVILAVDLRFSGLALFFDFLGMLLLLKLATTFKTLFQDSIKFLFLTLLVHGHEVTQLGEVLLMILK
jgi:hypothetical protein